MGIENAITKIGIKILTQARKSYVKPTVDVHSIKSLESYGLKLEQLMCDECNFSRVINLEKLYKKLIGDGIGLFHKPELKQAFGEKVKSSNIELEDLEQIMREVRTPKEIEKGKEFSFEFINLTNPTRNGFTYNGTSIARPLDFREAEFALKKNYSSQEISELVNVRERLINGKQIPIEDADVIIKNKMNGNTMQRFVSLRQQQGYDSDKALLASYLKESEAQAISNKEITKFLELKGKKITYQNAEGKALEYALPPEEAAYCAKYDFNEEQLQRFAKLRNEYFAQESVRNSGMETKFELQDILEWIKKDVSDQEIFNYNFIINNIQRFLDMGPILFTKDEALKFYQTSIKRIPVQDLLERKNLMRKISNKTKTGQQLNLKPEFKSKTSKCTNFKFCGYFQNEILVKNQSRRFTRLSSYIDYKINTPEQIFRYNELVKYGVDTGVEYIACHKELFDTIMRLAKDESLVFENFNGDVQKLSIKELAALSQFIDLTKIDIRLLLKKGLGRWHKICTGETGRVSRVFESARKLLQKENRQIRSNLVTSDIEKISKLGTNSTDFYKDCLRLDKNKNLIFSMGENSFKVAVEKVTIDGKSIVLIKDLEHEGQYYVGYKGAISKIDDLPQIDRQKLQSSLFGFSKYSKKQDEIYADAIEHFPIKIIDNKSECIIGKGLPALNINSVSSYLTDSEFVEHYQSVLRTLKDTGNLSVQNILRIMPRFSIIQINPYTTSKNGKMLYSISAEWKSADGVKWQLRTHSTDMGHYMNSGNNAENSDWIFRLGHEENGVAKFFEWNEAERKFTPTGDFMGRTSHIQIPHSPFTEENNLLENIHFQNIMRQISSNIL